MSFIFQHSAFTIMVRCMFEVQQEWINREIMFKGILYTSLSLSHTHTHARTHTYHKLCLMLLLNMEPTVVAAVVSNEVPIVFFCLYSNFFPFLPPPQFFSVPQFCFETAIVFCYLRLKKRRLCSDNKMIEKHEREIGSTSIFVIKTLLCDWLADPTMAKNE